MLQPGVVIGGRFRVDRVLGAGGMGVVVAATHTELGQQVALKVLHDELAANPTIVARFLREAKAVATLRTEHVCRVFDVGRLDSGAPFIVMEMLEGADLTQAALKGVPVTIAVEYVIQACVALAEAHAAGLVHRDIKPPNLFVVRKPDGGPLVKVLDFGIAKAATAAEAKLTHTTSTMGSPGYMSPEQIRSTRDVDVRTDIWALGVTLYQLLSGRMPFGGTQLAEIAVAVMTAAPPSLDVDPTLAAIVMRCLEKEPEKRFASVAELAVALMPFGGPSAPRFVREITRGAVGGTAPPQAPVVPVHAPTALTGLTGMTGMTAMTRGQHHVQAQSMPSHAPQVPPSGKGKWIAIGVVLIVVLVGGGALAGYLARGGEKVRVHDASVAEGSSTGSGSAMTVANDAGVVAVADASSSSDPWNKGSTDPLTGGEADETEDDEDDPEIDAALRAQMEMARGMLTPEQKKQTLAQMRQMESLIEQTKKTNPEMYQQQVLGFVNAACYLGDAAMAERWYAKLAEPSHRASAVMACKHMGMTIGNAAGKKM